MKELFRRDAIVIFSRFPGKVGPKKIEPML